ncbi:MAG: ATP-binding protein [Ginsengibacter sp.]
MTKPLKILLLEDSPADAEMIQRLLRKESLQFESHLVMTKDAYLQALDEFKPDLILSDNSMPQFSASEALEIIRTRSINIPFILVTGTVSDEFAANIIKSGADDYILKDRLIRLPAAISSALMQRSAAREKQEMLVKLKDNEERARVAIEAANMGTFDIDLITGESICSDRYNEIFGFKEQRLRAEYVSLIHPDDSELWKKAHEKSRITGRLFYECRILKKDKSVRWIRAEGIVRKDEKEVPVRLLGYIIDITEAKYLLKQKDDFIGIASHELKTPVTTIKAYTHILQERLKKRGDVPEIPVINNIDKQVNKLSCLIDNLLDATKMISGRLQLTNVNFKIDEMLTELIRDLQLTTDKKLILKLSADHCIVHADKERIEQTVTNLVNNAIKFSPDSDKIIIKTFLTDNDVQVDVQDFGMGIKEENKHKIFEQFYRVDGDYKYTFPGLGLGLYIASEIIKREGGNIWLKSLEGKGSTFSFSLPSLCSETPDKLISEDKAS